MHEGHRKRMYLKLENDEELYDHEILEILLYSACPRKNTNPIAHALLDKFYSLSEIFKADAEELKEVEGVGDNLAYFIRSVGLCAERAGKVEGSAVLKTFGDCKKFVSLRLKNRKEEFLELYFLDKNGSLKRIFSYTSSDINKVEADMAEIIKNISLSKPHGILIAHNHLNNSALPSDNDDIFTKQIQVICSMNRLKLWDHMIYAGEDKIYSYKDSGRLDKIYNGFCLENIMKWIKNSN